MQNVLSPWPWYVVGPLIGLTVPLLLLLGNKSFGVSSVFRHICASCLPARIPFFHYDWRKELWNLFFVGGLFTGAVISTAFLTGNAPIQVDNNLRNELLGYGVTEISSLMPLQLFNVETLFTLKGFILIVLGGFFVGFGTRYGGGCTSGHAIMGLSNLQGPSLIATCSFMLGGILMANFILPYILML